ncbi:MAG: imidazole glycerol phosphate synthase subunit HisF [Bacteroidia bacterium]|nr:imidazole glycerol phosphate synthase subunit HisF [Bacteroidia bacterium]
MLNKRLIPKLQLKAEQFGSKTKMVLVTTRQFGEVIPIGDPVSQARIYQSQAADELIFLDIRPQEGQWELLTGLLRQVAEEVFMPFTVGGGVRTLEDFRLLLSNGADKVSINSAAVQNPDLITRASERFGAQCVIVSIDYRRMPDGSFQVFTQSGQNPTGLDPISWALEAERRGAGEILLTSIDHDGKQEGLDIATAALLQGKLNIPLILGGGCGLARHFIDGFTQGGAEAVCAGTFFCFRDQNPIQTRSHIKNAGIPIRIHN